VNWTRECDWEGGGRKECVERECEEGECEERESIYGME